MTLQANEPGYILRMGSSCFASRADASTVLKVYQIWIDGKRSYYPPPCEEALYNREYLIYKHLGKHPKILLCLGLEELHPEFHSLRLELAPLGNVRQFIEDHENDQEQEQEHKGQRPRLNTEPKTFVLSSSALGQKSPFKGSSHSSVMVRIVSLWPEGHSRCVVRTCTSWQWEVQYD